MSTILPPMPDPQTGEPRPPAAPSEVWAGTGKKQPERSRERYTTQAPPPGKGPTLEGRRTSSRGAISIGAWAFGLGFVVLCVFGWVDHGTPVEWMGDWGLWLTIACVGALLGLLGLGSTVTCGADWVRQGKDSWVDTYDLAEINLKKYTLGYGLDLTDSAGRKFSINLNRIQETPLIWNLVYNGILHSAASGRAELNRLATERLLLPRVQDD